LFISFLFFLYIFLPKRLFRTGSKVHSSGPSTNIRFSSPSDNHVVPAIHPRSQPGQARLVSAIDDDCSGPCLLGRPCHDATADAVLHDVFIMFCLFPSESHEVMKALFSFVPVFGLVTGVSK
jgi:hypothetical protein